MIRPILRQAGLSPHPPHPHDAPGTAASGAADFREAWPQPARDAGPHRFFAAFLPQAPIPRHRHRRPLFRPCRTWRMPERNFSCSRSCRLNSGNPGFSKGHRIFSRQTKNYLTFAPCASSAAVAIAASLATKRPQAAKQACCRSSVVEHTLGKGEVGGSIPLGSTIFFS